jgi:hypothetical protein
VGKYSSLALDRLGNAHISYFDESNDDLKYAHYSGVAWVIQIADSEGNVGAYSSIDLDSNDYPHIAYREINFNDLKYARGNGGAFTTETVPDPGSLVGSYASLVVDAFDNPHISYYDESSGQLKLAEWTGTAWAIQMVDGGAALGQSFPSPLDPQIVQVVETVIGAGKYTSIALNPVGELAISYFDETANSLKYTLRFSVQSRAYLPLVQR